jgi:hypothetical protein
MSILYLIMPSLFPSMKQARAKGFDLSKYFIPVALLFTVGVVCSNQAYMYCNVAFLQFMKEWNVALVFLFSCLAGSQVCDRVKFAVVLWIVLTACMAVTGDMKFSHLGFVIQACSQLGETTRIVLQEWLLSGSDVRLDPLTYQVFVGPPTLAVLAVANYYFWNPLIIPALQAHWPLILGNASCAVILNVTIAVLIKNAGGMGMILSGIVKDVVIVCSSAYLAGQMLNAQQITGFILAMLGILYWGMLKACPNHIAVTLLARLLGSPANDEGKPLLGK